MTHLDCCCRAASSCRPVENKPSNKLPASAGGCCSSPQFLLQHLMLTRIGQEEVNGFLLGSVWWRHFKSSYGGATCHDLCDPPVTRTSELQLNPAAKSCTKQRRRAGLRPPVLQRYRHELVRPGPSSIPPGSGAANVLMVMHNLPAPQSIFYWELQGFTQTFSWSLRSRLVFNLPSGKQTQRHVWTPENRIPPTHDSVSVWISGSVSELQLR